MADPTTCHICGLSTAKDERGCFSCPQHGRVFLPVNGSYIKCHVLSGVDMEKRINRILKRILAAAPHVQPPRRARGP